MLFTNVKLRVQIVERDWGVLKQCTLGEDGRGRKLIVLPYNGDEPIEHGLHPDLTIGRTKTNRCRIDIKNDERMFMALNSHSGYTRTGNGKIFILKSQAEKVSIVALGNGADGDAGRIGSWRCAVLEVPTDFAIIRVLPSGGHLNSTLYVVLNGAVYETNASELERFCEAMGIEDMPCSVDADNCFNNAEWESL